MRTEKEIKKRYEKEKYMYKQACEHHLICRGQQCEGALNTLEWVLKDGEYLNAVGAELTDDLMQSNKRIEELEYDNDGLENDIYSLENKFQRIEKITEKLRTKRNEII